MAKDYWIVWNDSDEKGEGVIFDNEMDALEASDGRRRKIMQSAVGQAFHESYGEDGDLTIQPVQL